MSAHTPGPWANSGFTTQASIAGFRVVFPEGGEQPPPIAYVAANADARLIAAAPDLLAVAVDVVAHLRMHLEQFDKTAAMFPEITGSAKHVRGAMADSLNAADAAIAKARGVQPDSGPS